MEDNIKILYKFEAFIEKEVDKIEKTTKDGQPVEIKTKVKEKVPVKFAIKKPSRKEFEDARLHYGIEYSKAITAGLLTKGMLVNKYANTTGGVFSETEAKDLFALYKRQEALKIELQQAASVGASTESQDDLTAKLTAVSRQMFEIENSNNSLFQHTAENKAEERTIAYMLYHLTFIEKNNRWSPFFEGEDDDTRKRFFLRESSYFAMEDKDDPLILAVRDRLINLYVFYYRGMAEKQEDFVQIEADLAKRFSDTPKIEVKPEIALIPSEEVKKTT